MKRLWCRSDELHQFINTMELSMAQDTKRQMRQMVLCCSARSIAFMLLIQLALLWFLSAAPPASTGILSPRNRCPHEPFCGGKSQGCVTQSRPGGCQKPGKVREVMLERFQALKP